MASQAPSSPVPCSDVYKRQLPGLIAAFFWGETWVFWGITDLLGWPWRLKRSVREAPWRKEYQRRIGPIQIITGGLIMPASLLELMPAFLLSLLVTVAGRCV